MVRYILGALLVFAVIALLVLWVLTGGPRRVVSSTVGAFKGIVPSDTSGFRLPWQPIEIFPTIDISDALNFGDTGDTRTAQEKLADLQQQYDDLTAQAADLRTYGTPSPFMGEVAIVQDSAGVRESDQHQEYIQIAANYGNTSSIDIADWTLESALSGVRVHIPPGASPFLANSANVLGPTSLAPGALALVVSAPSPVGVSFQENMCSGYLGQFQSFNPPLADECPSPSEVLPLSQENLMRYGDSCFDALNNLSQCRFPQSLPNTVSNACRAYLSQNLSYNGCVQANRLKSDFQKNVWRVYLGVSGELWRNSHDAIRLLDAQGKTVSVFVY